MNPGIAWICFNVDICVSSDLSTWEVPPVWIGSDHVNGVVLRTLRQNSRIGTLDLCWTVKVQVLRVSLHASICPYMSSLGQSVQSHVKGHM